MSMLDGKADLRDFLGECIAAGVPNVDQHAAEQIRAARESTVFRIAFVRNPQTGRFCALGVREDGVPQGRRYQRIFPAAESWTEVRAPSFRYAVRAVKAGVASHSETNALAQRWYASVEAGSPDYTIYDGPEYVGAAWASWFVYSRKTLRFVRSVWRQHPEWTQPGLVVDLGCGVGLTTAALTQIFPHAQVIGTQRSGLQAVVARRYAARFGFEVHDDPPPSPDVLCGFEYFEHFQRPLEELRRAVACRPKMLVMANSFGVDSPGHFRTYLDGDTPVRPSQVAKLFDAALRRAGYELLPDKCWNSRPQFWRIL